MNLEDPVDQRKENRPRRRVWLLALPDRLRDRAIARMLARPRRGNVRVIDLATARQQRARRLAPQPGGAA